MPNGLSLGKLRSIYWRQLVEAVSPAIFYFQYPALRLFTEFVRLFAMPASARPAEARTAVLAPSTRGSLGDEAMLAVVARELQGKPVSLFYFVEPGDPLSRNLFPGAELNRLRFRTLPLVLFKLVWRLRKFERLWILGADMMDGHYSSTSSANRAALCHLAGVLGLESRILGFSYNETPTPVSRWAFRKLGQHSLLFARDPLSFQRLKSVAPGAAVLPASDLAFQLEPESTGICAEEIIASIRRMKSDNVRIMLGLNPNIALSPSGLKTNPDCLADYYVTELAEALSRHPMLGIVLIPHDTRLQTEEQGVNEFELGALILERLPEDCKSRILAITDERLSAREVKAICTETDGIITGKMHLAILALGSRRPVLCIKYQGKFDGLLQLFGLQECGVSPDDAFAQGAIGKMIETLIANRAEFSDRIVSRLDAVMHLSRSNFLDRARILTEKGEYPKGSGS
jgi:polysaccharide pyruvyl transferase WcaK-like protein